MSINEYKKFTECCDTDEYEVLTEDGWEDITKSNKTVKYKVYNIKLENGLELKCADNHILIDENYNEVFAIHSLNKNIRTKYGLSKVILIDDLNYCEEMYDLSVNSENHTYYTNNILSHNTTSSALYILWCMLFENNFTVGIVTNDAELSAEIVSKVKDMYELLPPFLQEGIKVWNTKSIRLANGNKILSAVASGRALRGRTLNILLIDEHAFIDGNKIKPFNDSVLPALSSGKKTKIIIISTPNGYNHFHKVYDEAQKGLNGYTPYYADWTSVPGRTQEWKRKEIASTSFVEFNQNHGCFFVGSSATLLSPEVLSSLEKKKPLVEDFIIQGMNLYKDFNPDSKYAISCDSSKTVGKENAENDYTCIKVLEYNSKIYEVASWRENSIHYSEVAGYLEKIGSAFDYPLIVIENNEGAGQSTADRLHDIYEYPNIYADPKHDGMILGIRTTTNRKSVGLSNIKKLCNEGLLVLNDSVTIDEFFTFIKKGKSYEAQVGATDDCVMSLNTNLLILMDEDNDLEVTIDDYLEGNIEEVEDSDQDLDFIGKIGKEDEDTSWLHN